MRSLFGAVCLLSCVIVLGMVTSDAGKDETAPSTTATPTTGTYTRSVTVTLTPNERSKTYYCTGNNCTPTSVYSQPLTTVGGAITLPDRNAD